MSVLYNIPFFQISNLWGLQKEDPKKTFIYFYQVGNLLAGIAKRIQIATASPRNDIKTISGSGDCGTILGEHGDMLASAAVFWHSTGILAIMVVFWLLW